MIYLLLLLLLSLALLFLSLQRTFTTYTAVTSKILVELKPATSPWWAKNEPFPAVAARVTGDIVHHSPRGLCLSRQNSVSYAGYRHCVVLLG